MYLFALKCIFRKTFSILSYNFKPSLEITPTMAKYLNIKKEEMSHTAVSMLQLDTILLFESAFKQKRYD